MVRSFSQVKTTAARETGISLFLFGKPKTRKTSFAARFPRPVVFRGPSETGIDDLKLQGVADKSIPVVCPESWEELDLWTTEVGLGSDYDTLIYDTAYDLQTLLYNYVGKKHFRGDMAEGDDKRGFRAYGKGDEVSTEQYLRPWLKTVIADILPSPKNVILIAHTVAKPAKNPDAAEDYDIFQPMVAPKVATIITAEFQQTGYIGYNVKIEKKGLRPKVTGDTGLFLNFGQGAYETANRYGLPDFIDMGESTAEGFANFAKACEAVNKPIAGLTTGRKTQASVPAPGVAARPRRAR